MMVDAFKVQGVEGLILARLTTVAREGS